MNILHINVCLDKGGAAKIALGLHNKLLSLNYDSNFAYGWGEMGGASDSETKVKNCFRIGSRLQVASNIITHHIIGYDHVKPPKRTEVQLRKAIKTADVVHLHVIHSYFIDFSWLVSILINENKAVVWTAHDYWLLTGRCAITDECTGWKTGCGSCPDLKKYPASYFDFSSKNFNIKRKHLEELKKQLVLVSPSKFLSIDLSEALPNTEVNHIPNWLNSTFQNLCREKLFADEFIELPKGLLKILLISNNLGDSQKVNVDLVRQLLMTVNVELHTIGSNSPFVGRNVFNHGHIFDREEMFNIISSCDVALHTSTVDSFGLVVIEALACGIPVLAIESKASREILMDININPVESPSDFVKIIENRELPQCYKVIKRAFLRDSITEKYSIENAVNKYVRVYKGLLSNA